MKIINLGKNSTFDEKVNIFIKMHYFTKKCILREKLDFCEFGAQNS